MKNLLIYFLTFGYCIATERLYGFKLHKVTTGKARC